MTVRIASLNTNVGNFNLRKNFTDTFNRADTGLGLGRNWIIQPMINLNVNAVGCFSIFSNQMRLFRNPTLVAGNNSGAIAQPWDTYRSLRLLNQFSQATFIALTGPVASSGPCVGFEFQNSTAIVCWYTLLVTQIPDRRLRKVVIGGSDQAWVLSFSDLITVAGAPGVNSIMRIECEFTPTGNNLEIFDDGISLGTASDVDANRAMSGSPGMFLNHIDPSTTMTWDNYSCGPL